MEISKGIKIVDTALWFEAEKVLVINDLHIGYEEALHRKGGLVPRSQLRRIIEKLQKIFQQVKTAKIIINGDLKHEFGTVLRQEWREVLEFLDFLLDQEKEVIIIKGNHDPIIRPIADKKGIAVVNEYMVGETFFFPSIFFSALFSSTFFTSGLAAFFTTGFWTSTLPS